MRNCHHVPADLLCLDDPPPHEGPAIIGFAGIVIIGLAEFAMDKPYMFWDVPQNVCLYILIGSMALIALMEVISAIRRKAALARA